MHEASQHEHNLFVTLTYAPEHLPAFNSLDHRDFQKFFKRLRKAAQQGVDANSIALRRLLAGRAAMGLRPMPLQIRYYMAGEYGELLSRPHYHACLFNYTVPDKELIGKTDSGHNIYSSKYLDGIWGKGMTTVGDVTFESAAYVARYVMKKRTGKQSAKHYEVIDLESGEIVVRKAEYNQPSRRPAIGKNWIEKYRTDTYPHGKIIINGKETKAPRYYDKQFERFDPEGYELMQFGRQIEAASNAAENTPRRLAAQEEVAHARLSHLKRTII